MQAREMKAGQESDIRIKGRRKEERLRDTFLLLRDNAEYIFFFCFYEE